MSAVRGAGREGVVLKAEPQAALPKECVLGLSFCFGHHQRMGWVCGGLWAAAVHGSTLLPAPGCAGAFPPAAEFADISFKTRKQKQPQSSGLALRAPDTIFLLMTARSERGCCPCKSQGLCGCLAHQQLAAVRGQRQ